MTVERNEMPGVSKSEPRFGALWGTLRRLAGSIGSRPRQGNLTVLEMTQLGEKRFVAMIRCGKESFLIGGAANSVGLLTKLAEAPKASSAKARTNTKTRTSKGKR